MSNLAIKTKNLKGRRSRRSGGSDPGSPFTPESSAGGGPDRYRADDESSVSTLGGSETPSHTRATNLSTASTQLIDNTASESSRTLRFDNRVVSPGSPSVSKNALVASRMLRSRKDRTRRAAAAQQLMERLVPARPAPVNIAEENPTESLRSRAKNRQRVGGGGGFAKLMVQAPSPNNAVTRENGEKDETDNTDPTKMRDEVIHTHLTAMELERLRKQALAEFTTGPQTNLRYHKAPRHLDELLEDDECSEASIPSILNRSEVFHENAAAAVVALLTPTSRSRVVGADFSSLISASSTLDEAGLRVTPSNKGLMITADHSGISAFRGPGSMINDSASVASSVTQNNTLDLTYEGHMPRSPISAPILSLDAERALNTVKRQMRDPGKTLGDLLIAVATPEDKSVMDRGFMVRRKNACGAVKVLTATASNRRTMCWTVGVLPALTSVLEDTGEDGLLEAFPDHRTRAEYVEARKRAVASLVNLTVPKENRIPIFHSPGLVQAVSAVIVDDRDESRQGCCALIAYLTKTQENRLLMVQVPGLIDALEGVIAPNFKMMGSLKPKKKKYHWDEDDSSIGIGNSTDIGNSFSTEFRNMSMATDGSDKYTVDGGMTQETGFTRESGVDSRGISYDDSDMTPQMSASPSHSLREVPQPYDKDPNKFLHGARKNVFASLMHVVREKDNAVSQLHESFDNLESKKSNICLVCAVRSCPSRKAHGDVSGNLQTDRHSLSRASHSYHCQHDPPPR